MPHTTTKIYSEIRNGVKYGVQLLTDICPVLGIVTKYLVYACCNSHGRINPWAKFKPERNSTRSPLTLTQRQNNNFGLKPADEYKSISALVTAVANGTFNPGWEYLAPRPGIDPSRQGDFDGYNHAATCPFGSLKDGMVRLLSADSTVQTTIEASAPDADTDAIQMSEFKNGNANYANWYFGILLYKDSNSYFRATTENTFAQGADWTVNFGHIPHEKAGVYKAVPFISNKKLTSGGSDQDQIEIVGIGSNGVTVTLQSTSSAYLPEASCWFADPSVNKISYSVRIHNTTSSAVTFQNVILQISSTESDSGAREFMTFGSVTIAAKGSWSAQGEKAIDYNGLASAIYRYFQLSTTGTESHTGWIMFEEPDQDPSVGPGM